MENIQKLLCEMQIQGQTHQAAASLETIQVLKSLETIQVLKYLSKTQVQLSHFALQMRLYPPKVSRYLSLKTRKT